MKLPLFEALTEYAGKEPARFHMPGHKGLLNALDVTETLGTDDLHAPSGAILESERLCAERLGAREAFFSVNGSTACMLAMLELAGRGERILLGRGCHKSAINGIALSDQEAEPLIPDENGVYSAEEVDRALTKTPCAAVFLTSPTYRGAVSPIDKIAEAAHRHGALLLVDAAHGAHFAYSGELPPVPSSADLWCVSSHKTLCALTQTALLLTGKSCPFPENAVRRALGRYLSTSPSYELMLSIERSVLCPPDWDAHISRIRRVRKELCGLPGVHLLGGGDITRLNIAVGGMNGRRLAERLFAAGVYPEMADGGCVTLITAPADPDEWYERLAAALRLIACDEEARPVKAAAPASPVFGERVMSVTRSVFAPRECVPLESSVGRVCAEACGAYPPGIAILFPGERITEEAVRFLSAELDSGAALFGLEGGCVGVVKEQEA